MATAGEGGAWGMAVLANYLLREDKGQVLSAYLDEKVFAGQQSTTLDPDPEMVAGFDAWMMGYKRALAAEAAAAKEF